MEKKNILTYEGLKKLEETLSGYDVIYLDPSLNTSPEMSRVERETKFTFDIVERAAQNGASVFVPNSFVGRFSLEFLGASDYKKVNGYPRELTFFKEAGPDLSPLTELV